MPHLHKLLAALKKNPLLVAITLLFVLSAGINVWFLLHSYTLAEQKYPLLAKRILREYPNDLLINFLPLRQKLMSTVEPYGDNFAMYFEYLPTGTSIGIHQSMEFDGASLLKVPVVMAYYRHQERLGLSEDPLVAVKESEVDNRFGSLWKKGAGYKLHLSEAVKLALTQSDNTAHRVILDAISDEDFAYVYEGLDLPLTADNYGLVVSPKGYSSVLKALYFASVLSKEHSAEILGLLTQSTYNDKLPAGIPAGIPIAHKIGVYDAGLYMDCGIVYLPRRPYLLCMVSKSDEKTARSRMKAISQIIYTYVSGIEH